MDSYAAISKHGGMPRKAADLSAQTLRLIFAKNIRLARVHAGISQEALAAGAGLDRTFVGSLERGLRNISIDNVELLAQAVGIPAHHLLDPQLAEAMGFDVTLTRAPRTQRLYTAPRKQIAKPRR